MATTKVLHISSVHSPFDSRIFQKECCSLARAGYEVSLLVPHTMEEVVEGIRIIPVEKISSRLQRMTSHAKKVISRAAKEHAAIYHLHDPELLAWCGVLRRQNAVVVYDMHEDLPFQLLNKHWIPPGFRRLVSFFAKAGERYWLRGIPTIFAEESYESQRPWLKRTALVMNFPRFDILQQIGEQRLSPRKYTIGYLGTVTPERGSVRYLEAVSLVREAGVEVQFECIGDIPLSHRLELERYSAAKGLSEVELVGYLPPLEGWARMAKWNVGLAVLEPIPNYLESYPTKLFEYMSMGIPAIVSDFPLYREIVQKHECGLLVDPLDARSIADAINYLIANPDKAAQMGSRGREAARLHYSWESQESQLLEFYKVLLEGD